MLLLVGEEIHDRTRDPQKNHLLVFGAEKELAPLGHSPQAVIDGVNKAGGLAFLAHPYDPAAPALGEGDISWVDWSVTGFTGIELWNGFSELKRVLKSKLHAIFYVFNPHLYPRGPFPQSLQIWDDLLNQGRKVVAIGGSDAHQLPGHLGPLRRTVFPYEWHFRCVNTHLLLAQPLSGELQADKRLIFDALRQGHAFVSYDLPNPTRGFRFTAQGIEGTAQMGDEIHAQNGVTFQIRLPQRAECILLKDGKPLKTWKNRDSCTHITTEPGVYRVEVFTYFYGRCGWIYSNPIYVRA